MQLCSRSTLDVDKFLDPVHTSVDSDSTNQPKRHQQPSSDRQQQVRVAKDLQRRIAADGFADATIDISKDP